MESTGNEAALVGSKRIAFWKKASSVVLILSAVVWWLDFRPDVPIDLTGDGCLVLAYHRIIPSPSSLLKYGANDDYTLYEDDFQEQIHLLKSAGTHFITPAQLNSIVKRQSPTPQKCVLVTFDDADVTQYRYAFPVLKQDQIPFALFVISGQVGSSDFNGLEMATWPQIREMVQSGLATVGSHTHNLHRLDSSRQAVFVAPGQAQQFSEDLQVSIQTIEQQTGVRPRYFAYPYGFGTPQTDDATLRSGMQLLFSLRAGIVQPGSPSFFVKRLMVTSRSWKAVAHWAEKTGQTS